MITRIGSLFFILLFTLLGGCASTGSQTDDNFTYLKKGIRINLTATKNLNTYNRQSHSLVLVAYQLKDPSVYRQMLDDPEGLTKLLEGESFDSSVLSKRKFVMQPSEIKDLYMDRVEGVRYLGIVAGYFSDDLQSLSQIIEVKTRERNPYFWRKEDKDPAETVVEVTLDKDRLTNVKLNNKQWAYND
ncbi:MAG: type VI secretion system lipoprotein TssJ [Gammaproteobacteria bacterium]|nr:type VI secretion system lipoprotein TssJ [Gammaproteobacteria bacterium]